MEGKDSLQDKKKKKSWWRSWRSSSSSSPLAYLLKKVQTTVRPVQPPPTPVTMMGGCQASLSYAAAGGGGANPEMMLLAEMKALWGEDGSITKRFQDIASQLEIKLNKFSTTELALAAAARDEVAERAAEERLQSLKLILDTLCVRGPTSNCFSAGILSLPFKPTPPPDDDDVED